MARFYLQVEAVNLDNVVYDTHDLSTIRGGSFMVMDAIQQVAESFKGRLQKITAAASQGLFALEGERAEAEQLLPEILAALNALTGGHATFLAACEEETGDFPVILERLQAQIRRQQWRMPTVAIPAEARASDACFLDGWRPGVA